MATAAIAADTALVREITDAEVWQFHEQGWVRLPGFVNVELVREMRRAAEDLLGASAERHHHRDGVDAMPDDTWWLDYSHVTKERIAPFPSFALSREQGRNVRRLFARDVSGRLLIDMVGAKAGHAATGEVQETPVHQDYPHGPWDRSGHCSFWVALEDMPADQGLVRFLSGSHREGSLGRSFSAPEGEHHDIARAHPYLAERYPASPTVPMRAGDATVHGPHIVHFAEPNRTDRIRWHYIAQYFAADARWIGEAFGDMVPGGNSGRLTTPGQLFDHPDWPVVHG